ncbi:hypothetical protein [Methylobacterium oryzisoli]|uniref:hypothetical protein n=1 Tax=Methylobacterium oryzisoli TaxID=3385502 RepID=UPI003891768E
MIDLVSMFAQAAEDLASATGESSSGFPVFEKSEPEEQNVDIKDISGLSSVSGSRQRGHELFPQASSRTREYVGGEAHPRGSYAETPEAPETPEMPIGSYTYFSDSSARKPGNDRETGNPAPLATASDGVDSKELAAIMQYEGGLPHTEAEALSDPLDVRRIYAAPATEPLPTGDGLALWWAGLARLSPSVPPCPDYREEEWRRVHVRAVAFLDTFGAQAEALGWTTPDLWGVHPMVGTVRVDHCGALVLVISGPIVAITSDTIRHRGLTFYRKPHLPRGVPLWSFAR